MNQPLTFNPHIHLTEVVLVGCGGTGAQIARTLCRIVYDRARRRLTVPKLRFVDPDDIAELNIGRQLYTSADCHHNKASVLARRFNRAMGLDIAWNAEEFDSRKHIQNPSGTLLCGAVDNHHARREMAKLKNTLLIDTGNSRQTGQCVIGNCYDGQHIRRHLDESNLPYLPAASVVFPNLLEPEPEVDPQPIRDDSCSTRLATGEQDLLVNDAVACAAGQFLFKIINQVPLRSWISYVSVDEDGLNVKSVPINREEVLSYCPPA